MCIICAKNKGKRLPTTDEIRTMFDANPHGAGYMFARDGMVTIHKGFMDVDDMLVSLGADALTEDDAVVYHFRISTQAGSTPEMTHPFAMTKNIKQTKALDVICSCGVAHNGIIQLTSDRAEKEYSDTALFISRYMSHLVRSDRDLHDEAVLLAVEALAQSKFALMSGDGYIATIGDFIEDDGLLFSNTTYRPRKFTLRDVKSNKPMARNYANDWNIWDCSDWGARY